MARLICVCVAAWMATAALAEEPVAKKGIEGLWYGVLKIGAIELRMGFIIEKKDDKLSAQLHSIDQGDVKIPLDSVEFADGTVTMKYAKAKLTYTGKLSENGNSLLGELDQGAKMKLDLTRTEKAPTNIRPQTPKKPYPYEEETVTFESKATGVKLAGTLTRPKGEGPFPVAVLITGSGPQDRDETLLGHKPFLILADHLTRKGIAVLRYDDRGTAKSTGTFSTATTKDFAEDTAGAVAYLKTRKEFGTIGLIGHSEGGLIAPIVAADNPEVGFIVMLAGPGLPGDEILMAQSELIVSRMGGKKEDLATQQKQLKKMIGMVKGGTTDKEIEDAVLKSVQELTEAQKKDFEANKSLTLAKTKELNSVWFRYFLTFDPRPTLARVKCPILAINGDLDLQVPCADNLAAIQKATKESGNKDVTTKELKGLNHLFQTAKTGLPSEYGVIEETFAPAALELVSEWIVSRTKKPIQK